MNELATFLRARLDEREALGLAMADAVWPSEVCVVPRMDTGEPTEGEPRACVSVAEHSPKAWARLWDGGEHDHGWQVHESALPVWSASIAQDLLADVQAKRRILDIHAIGNDPCDAHDASMRSIPCDTVLLLALPFANHEDYQEAWRPE